MPSGLDLITFQFMLEGPESVPAAIWRVPADAVSKVLLFFAEAVGFSDTSISGYLDRADQQYRSTRGLWEPGIRIQTQGSQRLQTGTNEHYDQQ
jgi:hypothetical protein